MLKITEEAVQSESKVSSMRLAFMRTVNTALFIATFSAIGYFVGYFFDKQIDLTVICALVGLLLGSAFSGKASQSFAENKKEAVVESAKVSAPEQEGK